MNGYCMNINVLGINQISLLKWRFSQSVLLNYGLMRTLRALSNDR